LARLLLLTIVLIAYGSLYPWHFHAYQYPVSPLWLLFHSPVYWNRSTAVDIAVNVLVYLPLGFFAFATLAAMRRTWVAAIAALPIGIALSFSMEMAQFFVEGRASSLLDVAANGLGAAAGIAAASIWWRHHHANRPTARNDSMFLIACWVLYQMFPFIPHRGVPRLILGGTAADALLYFATVIALRPVVDGLGGSIRRRRVTLVALVLLVPLRVVLFTRSVTIVEVAGTAAAFATVLLLPLSARVAAAIVGVAVVVHGLAPFAFQGPPHPFSWVPFQASLVSNWEPGVGVLLGKVYIYGSLLWLIRESGVRLSAATITTVTLLGAVEVAQVYLPGRTSEITDPVIAVILAWVFWSLLPNRSLINREDIMQPRMNANVHE
jgi:VanZ family protein